MENILNIQMNLLIFSWPYLQSTSAISTRYLELSLCRTFYLVPPAFSLTSLINPFGISNSAISNFHYVEQFSRTFKLSQTFKWVFQVNHTVHFRHSNVNNCIDKTLFGSLFFLFFNILSGSNMSAVKRQLNVKSVGEKCQTLRELEKGLSNKDVAVKCGVPKNNIWTWILKKSILLH